MGRAWGSSRAGLFFSMWMGIFHLALLSHFSSLSSFFFEILDFNRTYIYRERYSAFHNYNQGVGLLRGVNFRSQTCCSGGCIFLEHVKGSLGVVWISFRFIRMCIDLHWFICSVFWLYPFWVCLWAWSAQCACRRRFFVQGERHSWIFGLCQL